PHSSAASSGPARQSHSRPHNHSLSVGSLNPTHRVTRRKSTSSTAVNNAAAMASAVRESSGPTLEAGSYSKRGSTSKGGVGSKGGNVGGYPSFPSSLPNPAAIFAQNGHGSVSTAGKHGSAVTDGPPMALMPVAEKAPGKGRARRASEGSRKADAKRSSGSDLKCDKCGKGYKHSSCLTKHLWEHTPEWALTSKLLISKHQQVQLLEAASVLVAMNQEGPDSDNSSASPAASGSSDPQEDDGMSSESNTPPPRADEMDIEPYREEQKRYSINSSNYSQSYQSSVFSEGHGRPYISHYRQWSTDGRPTTSATSVGSYAADDQDHADLAAAVGLLSCSYGTPKSGPIMLPADAPPVPPLPARFMGQKADVLSGTTIATPAARSAGMSNPRFSYHSESKDVDMDEESEDDFDYGPQHRGRSHEEDEGAFGPMEE
ncbi:hypothetical protein K402DRAFT_308180, partial [Aulographum hederae CBS 113979]